MIPETQPLTPISTSTPDHPEARTPQSVRSLDSEPFTNPIPPSSAKNTPAQPGGKGRKRKLDRTNQNVTRATTPSNSMVNGDEGHSGPMHLNPTAGNHAHHNPHNHNHSTPCAKRQIIVQNELMDGNGAGSISGTTNGGGSITSGSVTNENGTSTSPHHSSIDTDNSGDSIRWRKNHHQGHWDGPVCILLDNIMSFMFIFVLYNILF